MLNLVQLQERLKDLPMQALMQYANGMNPQVPPFLALGELNRRKKMQENAAAEQAKEMAGAPSVKDQIEQATGLMALQGARQRQAAQEQAGIQAAMPMAAPNTMTSEPAQMASGGAVDDVMPRDYRRGGGVAGLNPVALKKLALIRAMKNERRPGLPGLPVNLFRRGDYAGGGIVAFAGDTDGSFVETSPGFYEQKEEEDEKINPAQKLLMDVIRSRKERPSYEERRRQAGMPEEAPDTTAATRADLERRQKELEASDTFVNRLLALQPGKFGSGKVGSSVAQYEEGRMAKMNEVRKLKAAADDQREAAKMAFKQGRFDEAEKRLEASDKFDLDAAKAVSELDLRKAQTEQALAGRTTDWMRRYNSYLPIVMQRLDIDNPEHPRVKAATAQMVDESIGRTREKLDIQQQGVGAQIMGRNLDIENAITTATEKITKEYKFPLAQARAEGNTAEVARLTKERDDKIAQRESDIRASGGQPAPSRAPAPETKSSEGKIPSKLPSGSKFIGTSGGKKVYELPDGHRVIEQ